MDMKENQFKITLKGGALPVGGENIYLNDSGVLNAPVEIAKTDEARFSNSGNIALSEIQFTSAPSNENWMEQFERLLQAYGGNGSLDEQDRIFGPHISFIRDEAKKHGLTSACAIWDDKLKYMVGRREKELGQQIHKGAPLYNTGLAYFVAGNFDAAFCYLAEAGSEDERNGRGDRNMILRGQHPLSRQMLVEPIVKTFFPLWSGDYLKITRAQLDEEEFIRLVEGLSGRVSDSLQVICALHKFRVSLATPQNHAAALIRVKAIGELVHLVESYLRQFLSVDGQLDAHLKVILAKNNEMKKGYDDLGKLLEKRSKANGWTQKTPDALNWIHKEAQSQISKGSSAARLAGVCAFFCHKYRNSLLHVNEESLTVFKNQQDCIKAVGWILSMLRVCKHAKDQTLAALP